MLKILIAYLLFVTLVSPNLLKNGDFSLPLLKMDQKEFMPDDFLIENWGYPNGMKLVKAEKFNNNWKLGVQAVLMDNRYNTLSQAFQVTNKRYLLVTLQCSWNNIFPLPVTKIQSPQISHKMGPEIVVSEYLGGAEGGAGGGAEGGFLFKPLAKEIKQGVHPPEQYHLMVRLNNELCSSWNINGDNIHHLKCVSISNSNARQDGNNLIQIIYNGRAVARKGIVSNIVVKKISKREYRKKEEEIQKERAQKAQKQSVRKHSVTSQELQATQVGHLPEVIVPNGNFCFPKFSANYMKFRGTEFSRTQIAYWYYPEGAELVKAKQFNPNWLQNQRAALLDSKESFRSYTTNILLNYGTHELKFDASVVNTHPNGYYEGFQPRTFRSSIEVFWNGASVLTFPLENDFKVHPIVVIELKSNKMVIYKMDNHIKFKIKLRPGTGTPYSIIFSNIRIQSTVREDIRITIPKCLHRQIVKILEEILCKSGNSIFPHQKFGEHLCPDILGMIG